MTRPFVCFFGGGGGWGEGRGRRQGVVHGAILLRILFAWQPSSLPFCCNKGGGRGRRHMPCSRDREGFAKEARLASWFLQCHDKMSDIKFPSPSPPPAGLQVQQVPFTPRTLRFFNDISSSLAARCCPGCSQPHSLGRATMGKGLAQFNCVAQMSNGEATVRDRRGMWRG